MRAKDLLTPLADILSTAMPTTVQRNLFGNFVPIFMLHRMECPDLNLDGHNPEQLAEFLEILRRKKFNFIDLETAASHLAENTPPPPRSIAFTIDDGFHDHYNIAAPILTRYDCPTTFFLATDFINQKLWPWDDQISYITSHCKKSSISWPTLPRSEQHPLNNPSQRKQASRLLREEIKSSKNDNLYEILEKLYENSEVIPPKEIPEKHLPMSWDNARSLAASGHCIAAHSKSHRILSQLSDQESEKEITDSINEVRKQVGKNLLFAYPTGRSQDFGSREIEILKKNGVKAATSTTPQTATHATNPLDIYKIPRLSFPNNKLDLLQGASWIEFFKHKIRKTL